MDAHFDKEVQISSKSIPVFPLIFIDGTKNSMTLVETKNGEGSYDIDMLALNHYNKHFTSERTLRWHCSLEYISTWIC